jgi:hypothetical protein
MIAANVQSAEELMAFQRRLVPRDKGNLETSIRDEVKDGGLRIKVIAGGTEATRREIRKGAGIYTDEAVLTEFGTKAHKAGGKFEGAEIPAEPARPFFLPPWRSMKRRIKGRASRAVSKAIKQIAAQ